MSDVRIRQALPSDLPGILAVEQSAFSDPWSAESFAPEFTDAYTFFRVAEVAGVIAGYVVARIVARQGEIANIAVAPTHRGTGVGGRLLDAAVAAAEAADCEAVWLEVRVSNEPARRLYASRGFVLVGRRKRYYRLPEEDALVLRREPAGASGDAPK